MAIAKHIIPGEKFHRLTVVGEAPKRAGNPNRRVTARCECGTIKDYVMGQLRNGYTKSCGCLKSEPSPLRADVIGRKFGRLLITGDAPHRERNNNRRVVAQCECGSAGEYFLMALKSGETKSCGCMQREGDCYKTHGHTQGRKFSPEYYSWASMMTRCRNPKSRAYPHYGGRGITVCERWGDFENFLADMGPRPDETTLERKNHSLGYSKENCEWATLDVQANNKRSSRPVTHNGETKTISQWAESLGMPYNTLFNRLTRLHWSPDRALTTPPKPSYQR